MTWIIEFQYIVRDTVDGLDIVSDLSIKMIAIGASFIEIELFNILLYFIIKMLSQQNEIT